MMAPTDVIQSNQRSLLPGGTSLKSESNTRIMRDDKRRSTHNEGLHIDSVPWCFIIRIIFCCQHLGTMDLIDLHCSKSFVLPSASLLLCPNLVMSAFICCTMSVVLVCLCFSYPQILHIVLSGGFGRVHYFERACSYNLNC